MLASITHKSSVAKNGTITITYIVVDSSTGAIRDIVISMPLDIAISTPRLAPIAIHQCFAARGRQALVAALDDYYRLLELEGYDSQAARYYDLAFYRRAVEMLSVQAKAA